MLKTIFGIVFMATAIGQAAAQLSVSPAIVSFDGNEPTRRDIKVRNTSSRTQYFQISAARIIEPGIYPETYLDSPDPEHVGLLVAPRRTTLQPNEERVIRVILLDGDQDSDAAWRVHIEPTIGEIETDKAIAVTLLAFKALIIARPKNPTTEIVGERSGRRLTLINRGNSNVVLTDGQQCPTDKTSCRPVQGKRLWPGLEWTTNLPTDAPVTFTTRGIEDEKTIEF